VFHDAGVANSSSPASYNDNITDSGWLTLVDNESGFSYYDYTAPSGTVGTRLTFKVQRNSSDIEWYSDLKITRFAIRKIS
jgi:hypothetical protein